MFLALILATLATAGVFMYSRGVEVAAGEDRWNDGPGRRQLKVDLPARTDMDQLIRDDQFRIIQVPEGVVVDGAVTSLDQLAGKSNSVAILAGGEQIPVARISGNVPGGALAHPEGMEAITVSLDASRGVAGRSTPATSVTIYGTFTDATDIKGARRRCPPAPSSVLTAELPAVFRPVSTLHVRQRPESAASERAASRLA